MGASTSSMTFARRSARPAAGIVTVVIVGVVITQLDSSYYLHLAILTALSALTAASLNVVYGLAGQISLGHIAFYGAGAYFAAIVTVDHGWSPWVALVLTPLATGVAGGLLAVPAFRTSGIYFAIVTLAVGIVVHIVMINWVDVTHGPQGMPGVPYLPEVSLPGLTLDFSDHKTLALGLWALVGCWIAMTAWLLRTRLGDAWIAIRENERLARSLGVPSYRMKVVAQAIAAAGAGLAGALLGFYLGIVSPATFAPMESLMILVIVVVGGAGRLIGPVAGAVVLTTVPEWLRFADELRLILFGLVLLAIVMFLPGGLVAGAERLGSAIVRIVRRGDADSTSSPTTSRSAGDDHEGQDDRDMKSAISTS